jgi:hypothetical protein
MDQPFISGEEQQQAIDKTKAATTNVVIITYSNLNNCIIIYSDVSQIHAIGTMLVKEVNRKELNTSPALFLKKSMKLN